MFVERTILLLFTSQVVCSYLVSLSLSGENTYRSAIIGASAPHHRSRCLVSMMCRSSMGNEGARRKFLQRALYLGGSLILNRPVVSLAEESADAVCNNILGCPIPGGKLRPPKTIYKDIFEEERALAKEAAERAEKERLERRRSEILVVRAQFAVVRKGLAAFQKDVDSALSDIGKSAENQTSWDDLRRMARLYDTAIRKDGMDLVLNNVRKLKLKIDEKAAEAGASRLTEALKGLDRAGKKKDLELSKSNFSEAVQAVESWLQLEAQLDAQP